MAVQFAVGRHHSRFRRRYQTAGGKRRKRRQKKKSCVIVEHAYCRAFREVGGLNCCGVIAAGSNFSTSRPAQAVLFTTLPAARPDEDSGERDCRPGPARLFADLVLAILPGRFEPGSFVRSSPQAAPLFLKDGCYSSPPEPPSPPCDNLFFAPRSRGHGRNAWLHGWPENPYLDPALNRACQLKVGHSPTVPLSNLMSISLRFSKAKRSTGIWSCVRNSQWQGKGQRRLNVFQTEMMVVSTLLVEVD